MSKLITYDLCAPGRNYNSLIEAIQSYPDWCKVAKSCWIISTADSCQTVRDNLWKHMDSNDILFVATLAGDAAWYNSICGNEALKRLLGS